VFRLGFKILIMHLSISELGYMLQKTGATKDKYSLSRLRMDLEELVQRKEKTGMDIVSSVNAKDNQHKMKHKNTGNTYQMS